MVYLKTLYAEIERAQHLTRCSTVEMRNRSDVDIRWRSFGVVGKRVYFGNTRTANRRAFFLFFFYVLSLSMQYKPLLYVRFSVGSFANAVSGCFFLLFYFISGI